MAPPIDQRELALAPKALEYDDMLMQEPNLLYEGVECHHERSSLTRVPKHGRPTDFCFLANELLGDWTSEKAT